MSAANSTRSTTPAQVETPRSCGGARPYYQHKVFTEALRRERVPYGAQLLFQELVRRSGRRGYTWVLQADLAAHFDVTTRTVRRWEASLAAAGVLTLGRVSFWARRRKGGVRRVAVPHVYDGEAFTCPKGILDDAKELLCDGRRVKAAAVRQRLTIRRVMSANGAATSFKAREKGQSCSSRVENQTRPGPSRETLATYLTDSVQWVREQGADLLGRWGWTVAEVMGPGWKPQEVG